MTPNWGERYSDHYERFLGQPVGREIFTQEEGLPRVQVLAYDGVIPDCRVFASLGLAHYADAVQGVGELIVPVAEGWDEVPSLLANAIFSMVQQRTALGWGIAISGLDQIAPEFVEAYQKAALYILPPFNAPEGFDEVASHGQRGRVYFGFFISPAELDYFSARGSEALEAALEKGAADPYALRRPSVV